MKIDIYSDNFRQNPYPFYEDIRNAGSAVYDSKRNVWYVGRYDDVAQILHNPENFTNKLAGVEPTLHGADGTLHAHSRKIVQKAFNKTRVNELNSAISSLADRLVARMSDKNECEFVGKIASHMPASVVIWMMGFENISVEDVRRWSDAIISSGARQLIAETYSKPVTMIRNGLRRFKGKIYSNTARDITECKMFLQEHFENARQQCCSGWVTNYLVNQEEDESLSMRELLDVGFLMIVAGAETTTDLISNAVLLLANNPAIQSQLRNNPLLLESFIEEVLRYDPPVQLRPRFANCSTMIGNVSVPSDSEIVILIGSANRDPEIFPSAEQFKIDRDPNKHLSFGMGRHFCLGAQLARRESFALLDAMIKKLPPVKLARPGENIEYPANITLRGPRYLPVIFS